METTPRIETTHQEEVANETDLMQIFGDDNDNDIDIDDEDGSVAGLGLSQQFGGSVLALPQLSQQSFSQCDARIDFKESVIQTSRILGELIAKTRNKQKQTLLMGAVVKLQEIAKGNYENLDNHSLEELLNQKLSHFTRHSGMTQRYSQDMPIGKEN